MWQNVFKALGGSAPVKSDEGRPREGGAASRLVHATAGGPGAGAAGLRTTAALEDDTAAAGRLDIDASMPMLSEIRQAVDAEVSRHDGRINHGALEQLRRGVASAIDSAVARKAAWHVAILKAIRDSFLAMPHVRAVVYRPIGKYAWKVAFVHDNEDDYAEIYKITDRIIEVEKTLDGFIMDPRILTVDDVERDGLGGWGTVIFDRRHEGVDDQKRERA